MLQRFLAALFLAQCVHLNHVKAAETSRDILKSIAKEFEGTYRFNYLFVENGVPYVDVSSHLQLLELSKRQSDGAPQISFFNQTSKGEKRSHYSYVFIKRAKNSPCGSSTEKEISVSTVSEPTSRRRKS
jgi:hypothetical protein